MQHPSPQQGRDWNSESLFALAGFMLLGARLVQGWVFWAAASRRLFYLPGDSALDPASPVYAAGRLLHAMPGSAFPSAIAWLLQTGGFLHFATWLWTLLELAVGLALLFGIGTRLGAFFSVLLNAVLMATLGWTGGANGGWAAAATGFAIGGALLLAGGGDWSLDHWLAQRYPETAEQRAFRRLCSGPLGLEGTRRLGIALGLLGLLFAAGFYQYFHGGVFSPAQPRVDAHHHGLRLTAAAARADGSVAFSAYVDAGPAAGALYLIGAELLNANGIRTEHWNGVLLSKLPEGAIENRFRQPWAAQFRRTLYGIGAGTGARARIRLPGRHKLLAGRYTLRLTAIDGRHWQAPINLQ